jgi:hypothetical protein
VRPSKHSTEPQAADAAAAWNIDRLIFVSLRRMFPTIRNAITVVARRGSDSDPYQADGPFLGWDIASLATNPYLCHFNS